MIKNARKIYKFIVNPKVKLYQSDIVDTYEWSQFEGNEVSEIIYKELSDEKPSLITRFGSTEMLCLMDFLHKNTFKNKLNYIFSKIEYLGWRESTKDQMWNYSGFFPPTDENMERYANLIIELMPDIDILGTWLKQEKYFIKDLINAKKVPLYNLEPFYYDNPWTRVLKGKNVLVIHPFESTIKYQYKNRQHLFENKNILPDFNLLTIKAVQSIAGNKGEYESWFEAFEYMKNEINNINFDIAILACGAYGMPLGAYIKKIGKKAIHLGGSTQLLFGIKGSRWENKDVCENSDFYMSLYNKYWIRPLGIDIPNSHMNVENGCYW